VDRAEALNELPAPYGLALTLLADGHDEADIAERIAVPVDAIAALLEVGEAKLAALIARSELGM
jgi:DNA-directed RNA polymerase specialized sigma24 family protein